MAGIVAWGSYVPPWRLRREKAGKEWGIRLSGETAVAGKDEDAFTMGIEAASIALTQIGKEKPQAIYFASSYLPAQERNPGALAAFTLGLGQDIRCANFSGSCSAGAEALLSALDLIESGNARRVLVIVGEAERKAAVGSRLETTFGAGAVAFVLDKEGEISAGERACLCGNFPELWSSDSPGYLEESDFNFQRHKGYVDHMVKAMQIFNSRSTASSGFDHMAYHQPDEGMSRQLQKRLQIEPAKTAAGRHVHALGDLGSVSSLLSLTMVLEAAKPGERILLSAYGGGTCIFIMFDTDPVLSDMQDKITLSVQKQIEVGKSISYPRFLKYRGLLKD
jgi:hydroxymethylglutaryl-CoA synthase